MFISLSKITEPTGGYITVCDGWPVWCLTGYLSSQRALPFSWYSFYTLLRAVSLSGWLYTKMVYPQMVTHLSTNRRRVTSLMRPTTLLIGQTARTRVQMLPRLGLHWQCFHSIVDVRWPSILDFPGQSFISGTRPVIMVALCNRAGHYIFALWLLSIFLSFFFLCLISAAGDWMSAILPHMVWP